MSRVLLLVHISPFARDATDTVMTPAFPESALQLLQEGFLVRRG